MSTASHSPVAHRPFQPASETEALRLTIAHQHAALNRALTIARNSLKTASPDVDGWREDMQHLVNTLERDMAT